MTRKYTTAAIWLHWLIALGMMVNVALAWLWPLGDSVGWIGEYVRPMINGHKSIGITILVLAVLRLLWRLGNKPPAMPAAYAGWEKTAAHVVHWGLYFVILAMPITGWVMDSAWDKAAGNPNYWFGLFEWPRLGFIMTLPPETKKWVHDSFGEAHELIAWAVYGLFVLHVAGALKHQLQGHSELQRMGMGR